MEKYEIAVIKYNKEGATKIDKAYANNAYQLLFIAFRIILQEIEKSKVNGIVLSKEECQILLGCPYVGGHVNEENYPGYNDVIDKIHKFAQED